MSEPNGGLQAGRHSSHARYWLTLIVEATKIEFRDKSDLNLMRAKVSLAHTYARAALLGREPMPAKELEGQLDLFAEPCGPVFIAAINRVALFSLGFFRYNPDFRWTSRRASESAASEVFGERR